MMYDLEMMKQFYVSYNGKVQDTRKKLGRALTLARFCIAISTMLIPSSVLKGEWTM